MSRVAATVSVSDSATEGIVGDCVGDSGDRDIHQRDTVTRERQRLVGRVGDGLARGDDGSIKQHFIYRDIASNVKGARTRRKRDG